MWIVYRVKPGQLGLVWEVLITSIVRFIHIAVALNVCMQLSALWSINSLQSLEALKDSYACHDGRIISPLLVIFVLLYKLAESGDFNIECHWFLTSWILCACFKSPFSIATKMLLNPVFCSDTVIALHELCDSRPNILVADRTLTFDLELTQVHLPLLHLSVDDLGNAGVPAVSRGILRVLKESSYRQLVQLDHHV